jgi:hypothetical protein
MLAPLRALKRILIERRALAQKEQQVLSRMLDVIPALVAANGSKGRQAAQKVTARRRLVCRRCDRRFALPMHLGRHMAMSHQRRRKAA